MRPDVKINDLSLFTLGWLRESVDFPTPQSQTNTIVVPGRNAPIRYTGALGSISYQPREFTILLSMLGSRTQFDLKVAEVVNRFAGRLCKVICSDTPQVYAIGTIEAEPAYDPLTGKGQLTLSCEDGDSYLYHVKETVVTKSGSGTVTLFNDYMPLWWKPPEKRRLPGESERRNSVNRSAPVPGSFRRWSCRPEKTS